MGSCFLSSAFNPDFFDALGVTCLEVAILVKKERFLH